MSSNSRTRALLSKENYKSITGNETGETSFRVYYGATGAAIPFMWESQPGTPKHPMFNKSRQDGNDQIVPPLTPPPSYTTSTVTIGHISNKRRKSRIFDVILSSLSRKNNSNNYVTPMSSSSSPLSWSTTSSSSSSSISSPRIRKNDIKSHRRSISLCSFGAKSSLFGDEDHNNINDNNNNMDLSPNSALCFGFKKKNQGCYSMQDMKNALFSIKGH